MCGIGAIVSRKPVPAAEMVRQCLLLSENMAHRGPDDEGFVLVDANGNLFHFKGTASMPGCPLPDLHEASGEFVAALVHRRLSIIAPGLAGHQPMVLPDGNLLLSYNGEMFNFTELNESNVFPSVTGTDSETLLRLLEKRGFNCLHEADGFFAGLVWDTNSKSLKMFRDVTGVKPLFHCRKGDAWYFSSETKPLRKLTGFNSADPVTIFHHLTEGIIGDKEHHTFFSAIHEVPKGAVMEWTSAGGLTVWGEITPEKTAPVHLKERLAASIKGRLLSDVPLGFAVSGGLDSAAIIGLARMHLGKDAPLKLFSVVSEDAGSDESEWQKMVSDHNHAERFTVALESVGPEILKTVVSATDMPVVAWNNIAHFELCRLAKSNGVTVLFNGQGADEIFGGYPDYLQRDYYSLRNHLKKYRSNWPLELSEIKRGWQKLQLLKYTPEIAKQWMFQKQFKHILHPDILGHPSFLWSLSTLSADEKMQEDYYGKKLGQMLLWEDRNGMANSLESRNPFADDHSLAAFLKIPFKKKIANGFTKGVLRDALKDIVPEKVLWRTDKKGFTVPDASLTWKHRKNWEAYFMSEILNDFAPKANREELLADLRQEDTKSLQWYFRLAALSVFLEEIK